MDPRIEHAINVSRRMFLRRTGVSLGTMALAELLHDDLFAETAAPDGSATGGLKGLPHFAPTAKRVIYIFNAGGPSQLELYDYKPGLEKLRATDLPESIRGARLTTMTATQEHFPIAPSIFKFAQHGKSGAWLSELLPNLAKQADDLLFIKSMHTEQINHDPAQTFISTGFQIAGRPSLGAWVAYGLGSTNKHLPAFVVMPSSGQS